MSGDRDAELAALWAELEDARDREAALREVVGTMARSSADLDTVLQAVVDSAVRLCRADHGNIARRIGDAYCIAALTSFSPEYEELARRRTYVPERESVIGRALLERSVVHIPDVVEDPEYSLSDLQRAGRYRTVLAVPLLRDGEAIGALAVGRTEVSPFGDSEIRLLETFADHVVVAIENARLFGTVARQRAELARFAPQAAGLLASEEGERLLAGHRREISAVYFDLRGFTAFAETADPEEVLGVLRLYHRTVGEVVLAHDGSIEHFAGDGLLAFFNDPTPVPEHELAAVLAAGVAHARFAGLQADWLRRGYDLGLGIGVATGFATLGRIGFEGRYDYGAVGNVVILAARLSDVAEPGETLLSQRTHAALGGDVAAEPLASLVLKGYSRPVTALRVTGALSSADVERESEGRE